MPATTTVGLDLRIPLHLMDLLHFMLLLLLQAWCVAACGCCVGWQCGHPA
jgi:hypothetical protein